jgi:hypothetical protein
MKKRVREISDDEIQVIGGKKKTKPSKTKIVICISVVAAVMLICALLWSTFDSGKSTSPYSAEPGYFEPSEPLPTARPDSIMPLAKAEVEETGRGFIEIADTTINDIPLRLYLPHAARMSLQIGYLDRNDTSILFATQAADIRADNGGIVGAFVLQGEPKAWGLSKKGFCAIINDTVTVGMAENSPLFEKATEKGGYFFRQFPLVDNGKLVENEQKGKSVRRALCQRGDETFTIETLDTESFHDFAQALVDLGVDNAIYLIGSNAYGWATDADGQRHEFGNPAPPKKRWKNINYLVMRNKD